MHGAIFRDRVRGGNNFRRQSLYKSKTMPFWREKMLDWGSFPQLRLRLFHIAQQSGGFLPADCG
jgi:hypothetical protein